MAVQYLRRRLGEVDNGLFLGRNAQRLTVEDLCQVVVDDYEINGYRSLPDLQRRIKNQVSPLVGTIKAAQFGSQHVKRYISQRNKRGAAAATINRELNIIRRGFQLAYQSDPPLVARIPHIQKLAEKHVRRSFLDFDPYSELRAALPFYLQVFLVIGYNSGVRKSEVLGDSRRERPKEPLTWTQVDFEAKRIYFPETKNGEARFIPFIGDMEEWLRMAWDEHVYNWPECPYVIQRGGRPVSDPRKAWKKACQAVGLPGLWPHDLRRSAIRNLDRAGVSPKIATAISGHKTRSVYERYNIVADRDLADAAEKVDRYLEQRRERIDLSSSKVVQ